MSKGSCGPRHLKQQRSGIRSFGLANQSSKSLAKIGGSMCREELVEELHPPPVSDQPLIMKKAVIMGGWGILPITKSGIYTSGKAKGIRPAITAYCSITWSHLECGLWLKNLYSCKIMTQSIRVNFARGTLKAKRVTARHSTDVLSGAISGLKSHWTGMGWTWPKSQR